MSQFTQFSSRSAADPPLPYAPVADPAFPLPLTELYRREHVGMTRLAHLLCGNNAVAEEIVHEAFIRLQQNWSSATDHRAYLRKIVVNLCRSHHRRNAVEARHRPLPPPPVLPPEVDETWQALRRLTAKRRAALTFLLFPTPKVICSLNSVGFAMNAGS